MSKRKHLDQYYTQPTYVDWCVEKIKETVPEWNTQTWIDFSAGDNAFLKKLDPSRWSAFDLEPLDDGVTRSDWYAVTRDQVAGETFAVGFNPPYGKMGYEARRFIKHAVETFKPQVIAVISPRRSWGWLVDGGYEVVHVNICPEKSFYTYENGKHRDFNYNVPFVILKRSMFSASRKATASRFVDVVTYIDKQDVAEYDMIVSCSGLGNVFMHVVLRTEGGWSWFVAGDVTANRLPGPDELSLGARTKILVRFSTEVSAGEKLRVAGDLHKLADYNVCGMVTPAAYKLDQVRAILEDLIKSYSPASRDFISEITFTYGDKMNYADYDMIFGHRGQCNVFKHTVLKVEGGWRWFSRGILKAESLPPDGEMSLRNQAQMMVKFSDEVTSEERLRVAQELHTLADYSVCGICTPPSYTLTQARCILERFIASLKKRHITVKP